MENALALRVAQTWLSKLSRRATRSSSMLFLVLALRPRGRRARSTKSQVVLEFLHAEQGLRLSHRIFRFLQRSQLSRGSGSIDKNLPGSTQKNETRKAVKSGMENALPWRTFAVKNPDVEVVTVSRPPVA